MKILWVVSSNPTGGNPLFGYHVGKAPMPILYSWINSECQKHPFSQVMSKQWMDLPMTALNKTIKGFISLKQQAKIGISFYHLIPLRDFYKPKTKNYRQKKTETGWLRCLEPLSFTHYSAHCDMGLNPTNDWKRKWIKKGRCHIRNWNDT